MQAYWLFMSCVALACAYMALDEFDQNRRADEVREQRKAATQNYYQTGSSAELLRLYRKFLAEYNADPDDPVKAFAVITTQGAILSTCGLSELKAGELTVFNDAEQTMLKGRSDQLRIALLARPFVNDSRFDWSTFRYLEQRYPRDSLVFASAAWGLSRVEKERDFEQILSWSHRSIEFDPLNPDRHIFHLRHLVSAAQNSGDEKDWIAADAQLKRLRAIKDKDPNRESHINHEIYALDKHFQRFLPSYVYMDWNQLW